LYELLLWRCGGALRWGGLLLALNGAACILGVVGSLAGIRAIIQGWDAAMKQLPLPTTIFHAGSVPIGSSRAPAGWSIKAASARLPPASAPGLR
jgi:hypothetical protein